LCTKTEKFWLHPAGWPNPAADVAVAARSTNDSQGSASVVGTSAYQVINHTGAY
jgi:hypothetical protein